MGKRAYAVYMLASKTNGTLYVGATSNLSLRVYQHKSSTGSDFTSAHNVHRLVWYEYYDYINDAIAREKQLKNWHRSWKIRLIVEMNPDWDDLYESLNR